MNPIKKIKNICEKAKLEFKDRFSGRQAILNDMRALDEAKEIFSMAAVMSNTYRRFKDKTSTPEELTNLIRSHLESSDSLFESNMLESYSNMSIGAQNTVIICAHNNLKHRPDKEKINGLAISGAGGKGQFFVGAIKALEDQGVLKNIETFAGTSAGALTAIPLCMGINSRGLEDIVRKTDFRIFMIEGSAYNTTEKRLKRSQKFSGRKDKFKQLQDEVAVEELINSIKVLVEEEMDLHKNRAMFKSGLHSDLESKQVIGEVVNFMGIKLSAPLKIEFTEEKFSENVNLLWSDHGIQSGCAEKVKKMNEDAHTTIFQDPKELLKIGLSFAYKMDYVEFYFGKLIYERIRDFVNQYGEDKLQSIIPNMKNQGNWSSMSLKDLGLLARSKEGHDFGFRDLAIGVTETANKKIPPKTDEEPPKSSLEKGLLFSEKLLSPVSEFYDIMAKSMNQIFRTKGVIVSSNPEQYGDESLSEAPLKEIARMSMSIPFHFNQKLFGNTYFVDGGLHHNLPTKYFDNKAPNGFDNRILSIIPLTASEIDGGKTVKDCFYSPGAFSPSRQSSFDGWKSFKSVKAVIDEIKEHLSGYAIKGIITKNNHAYKEMGLRESFRNIIINTLNYNTMSFSSTEDDFKNLNDDSYRTVVGERLSDGGVQSGVFDSQYNSYIRLLEHKVYLHKREKPEVYEKAKREYQEQRLLDGEDKAIFSPKGLRSIERMMNENVM